MIFSHDYFATASDYLGLYREIASHGHIVFAVDQIDGSCRYTEL